MGDHFAFQILLEIFNFNSLGDTIASGVGVIVWDGVEFTDYYQNEKHMEDLKNHY